MAFQARLRAFSTSHHFCRLLSLALASSAALAVEQAQLVKDIDAKPNTYMARPSNLCEVNGTLFFSEQDSLHGTELWMSDGTAAGTHLVKDINPTGDSFLRSPVAMGNTLFFTAYDGTHGTELWKSDGTKDGTVMVKDISPGPSGFVFLLTPANGWLYFGASDPDHGQELWKTDGTEANTVLVKDISPGPGNGMGGEMVFAGGTLFFTATTPENGTELWKTDGTEAGTVMVKDILPGPYGSGPRYLTAAGSSVFFTAYTEAAGTELWRSDGTEAGTTMVADLTQGTASTFFDPDTMAGFDGALYFVNGQQLWKSGGTVDTTAVVKDAAGHTIQYVRSLAATNNALYVVGLPGPNAGGCSSALWRTDGTVEGTVMLTQAYEGSLENLHVNGSMLLFTSSASGQLWKSDGTPGTTWSVGQIPYPLFPTDVSAHTFFINVGTSSPEVWRINSAGGAAKVTGLASGTLGSSPSSLTSYQGRVFFAANDGVNGSQLWASDGTPGGTAMVRDSSTSPAMASNAHSFVQMGGLLYFQADSYPVSSGLFRTDGTAAGTILVSPASSYPPLALVGDHQLFFVNQQYSSAQYPTGTGNELFVTDGSAAGTKIVKDIYPGATGSNADEFAAMNGALFFTAADSTAIGTLYRSDGTGAGTVPILDGAHRAKFLTVAGSTLFFFGTETATGTELWKTDGTAGGAVLVKDIAPGTGSSVAPYATLARAALGPLLIFAADDKAHGIELWKSDGTPEGTVMLKDIAPGAAASSPSSFMVAGSQLFFTADDQVHGRELWVTDGTEAGTHLVADLMPGAGGSGAAPLMADGGVLYFDASNDVAGKGLWRSDGTAAGTFQAALPPAGADGWVPVSMAKAGGKLFVSADTLPYGTELFIVSPPAAGTQPPAPITSTTATLQGTVDPGGVDASAEFHYGLTSAYGGVAPVTPSPVNGNGLQLVSAAISGLQPGTTYHFCLVTDNGGGPQSTPDATFSTAPALAALTTDAGQPSPVFDPNMVSYSVTVPYTTSSLTVIPTAAGSNSTLAVNGTPLGSGVAGAPASLLPGPNRIPVVVTAQDGVTARTYLLRVTRTPPVSGLLAFESASFAAGKNDGHATVRVVRSGGIDGSVSARVSTKNGTALANNDYLTTSIIVSFLQGETFKDVDIPLVASSAARPNKAFSATLENNQAILGKITTATVVIVDPSSSTAGGDPQPPPAPGITTPAANASVPLDLADMVSITGKATDNKAVHKVRVSVNGAAFADAVLAAPDAASTAYSFEFIPTVSRYTIKVQSFDINGHASAVSTRSFIVTRPLSVSVAGEYMSGTVTSGFVPLSYHEPGKPVTLTATAKPGYVFDHWIVGDTTGTGITALMTELPVLTFTMPSHLTLVAVFFSNPFTYSGGAYEGLVQADPTLPAPSGTAPSVSTEGRFTGTVQTNGTFTGSLMIDGLTVPCAGVFDNTGVARFGATRAKAMAVPRPGKPGLSLALQLDTNYSIIGGTVTATTRSVVTASSTLTAHRSPFSSLTPDTSAPYEFSGDSSGFSWKNASFAFVIPAGVPAAQPAGFTPHDYPQGTGFGTMTMTVSGAMTFSGTLADGTAFTSAAKLTQDYAAPYYAASLFAQIYGKLGFLSARVDDSGNGNGSMVSTDVRWSRPFQTGQYYPYGWPEVIHAGFQSAKITLVPDTSVFASLSHPGHKTTPLPFSLTFADGGLPASLTKHFTLTSTEAVGKVPVSDPSFTLSVVHSNGTFSGTFTGQDGKKRTFNGINLLFGDLAGGNGFFLSPKPVKTDGLGESGSVRIVPE